LKQLNLYITDLSITDREQIERQLAILKPFLTAHWLFLNDNVSDCDLLLVKEPCSPNLSAKEVVELKTFRDFSDKEYPFEWPIRLFNLMDMLNIAHGRLASQERLLKQQGTVKVPAKTPEVVQAESKVLDEPVYSEDQPPVEAIHPDLEWRSVAKWLATVSNRSCVYQFNELLFACIPERNVLITNASEKEVLFSALIDSSEADWVELENAILDVSGTEISLNSVIWSVALKEPEYAEQQWASKEGMYRLKRWPQLGVWSTTPAMFKLSSLYGRKSASIKTGVMVSGAVETEVALFLHACDAVGLGVDVVDQEVDSVTKPPIDASLAVLQAFKSKLGI
jgi:hypothetical protein